MPIILCAVIRSVCPAKDTKRGVSATMTWFTQVELSWCLPSPWALVYSFETLLPQRQRSYVTTFCSLVCMDFFPCRENLPLPRLLPTRPGTVLDNWGRPDCPAEPQDPPCPPSTRLGPSPLRHSPSWPAPAPGGVAASQSTRVISWIPSLK